MEKPLDNSSRTLLLTSSQLRPRMRGAKTVSLPGFQTQRCHELTKMVVSHATKLGGLLRSNR